MKKITALIVFACFIALTALGQNEKESFAPSGKMIMRIFSNYHTTFSGSTSVHAFELDRAYLGYQHEFSKNLSARVLFDVTIPKEKSQEITLHVKNAFVNYSKDDFTVTFGMIPTSQVNLQEDYWGYRYLLKSFQDLNKMASTADVGISASYQLFEKKLSADFSIVNGEGYKYIQSDNKFKTSAGLTLRPAKDLTLRAVYDFMGENNPQTSFISFIGYKIGRNTIGAEYNQQQNVGNIAGKNYWGTSVYVTIAPVKNIELFGRYDYLVSNTIGSETGNWNASKDGSLIVAGVEYEPLKGLKLTPNYRFNNPSLSGKPNTHSIYMNVEVRF